jgi:hypothetical protein
VSGLPRFVSPNVMIKRSENPQPASPPTVALILGPYRNLTTLTASLLSLHPHCQVLNHGLDRVLRPKQDFLRQYSDERLDRFCAAALKASVGGKRGDHGGSIQYSGGFERGNFGPVYEARYGTQLIKDDVRCLVWKESQGVTNRIRLAPDAIGTLVAEAPRLRYLMPVRNPIACALSNIRKHLAERIAGVDPSDAADVLDRILEQLAWFARSATLDPDRFFMFFEDDTAAVICDGLVRTFAISDDDEWRRTVEANFVLTGKHYSYEPELVAAFETSVQTHLSDLPELADRVTRLVRGADAAT